MDQGDLFGGNVGKGLGVTLDGTSESVHREGSLSEPVPEIEKGDRRQPNREDAWKDAVSTPAADLEGLPERCLTCYKQSICILSSDQRLQCGGPWPSHEKHLNSLRAEKKGKGK